MSSTGSESPSPHLLSPSPGAEYVPSTPGSSCYLDGVSTPPPVVAVVGIGYVGRNLVDMFSSHYQVIGFDVSNKRIAELSKSSSPGARTAPTFTCCESDLKNPTYFLIAVPTPLSANNGTVDLSFLESAVRLVARHADRGSTVVIESSVGVGTTRRVLGPVAEHHGFYAGMSPERVDPGRAYPTAREIPKIISGLDDVVAGSLSRIQALYEPVFASLIPVTRPEVAEMTKLYENCQRMVAIAYANEMADACLPHGIDPFEVSAAAATKPFGYLPINPSLGVGGHCIPLNPHYLLESCDLPLLRAATRTIEARPADVAGRILAELLGDSTSVYVRCAIRPRVLVVGMGFKTGQSHLANSPGLQAATVLRDSGKVDVLFADPLVDRPAVENIPKLPDSQWTPASLRIFDAVLVAVKQPGLDYGILDNLLGVKVHRWCP